MFALLLSVTLFYACQKNEHITPPTLTPPVNISSLFTLPGVTVQNDGIFGTYLCIDSMKTLHLIESFLQNQPDSHRQIWESTIGFYSRETTIQRRMKFLVDSLKVLELDMEENDELYHELWSEYRELQYRKEMTAEMDKFVNDQGYVMFRGQMWMIRDTLSYLVLAGGTNVPYHTFSYSNNNNACYKSKQIEQHFYSYEDLDSTYYKSCFERKLKTELINYESVWGYHYCKFNMEQDYMICANGRWLPMTASTLRLDAQITYEQNAETYFIDNLTSSAAQTARHSYTIAIGPSSICIQHADCELKATNNDLSPEQLLAYIYLH